MSFAPYSNTRPSGVDWIGSIPTHWHVQPLVRQFSEHFTQNADGAEGNVLSLSYGRIVDRDVTSNDGLLPDSFDTYQIVERGDIVLRPTDMQNDQRSLRTGIVGRRGIISSAYICLRARNAAFSEFGHLVLHAVDLTKVLYSLGGGLRQSLKFADLRRLPLPVPPEAEQAAIAAFLARETGKIDALVAEQERLIALLKEKRQALISHAVTKGLDPNVPMKDSGVEWLGQVPAHWTVLPLKRCIDVLEGPGILAEDFADEGVPLLRISSIAGRIATLDGCNYLDHDRVSRKWRHFRVVAGDLLISGSASTGLCAEVDATTAGSIPYTGIIIIRPRDETNTRGFARWFLLSDCFATQVELAVTGSTIKHYGPTHLAEMFVALPPKSEQLRIATVLDHKSAAIGELIGEAQLAAELLRERRGALIAAAVTGKIDVRGLA